MITELNKKLGPEWAGRAIENDLEESGCGVI
jgi:hypothetical protein